MPIKSWFPTFIYQAPLARAGVPAINRTLIEECTKLRAHDENGRRWCTTNYPGGYTSYASFNHLHRSFSTFEALEKKLRRHVRAFARHLELDLDPARLTMTDCWVNVMPRHAVHGLHLHP